MQNSDSIKQVLQEIYRQNDKLPDFFDDESISEIKIDDHYINLSIIKSENFKIKEQVLVNKTAIVNHLDVFENLHSSNENIKLEEIFDINKTNNVNKILITGGGGTGKTVFMQYISYMWAKDSNDSLWKNKFDYVFILPLRLLGINWYKDNYGKNDRCLSAFIHYCSFKEKGKDQDISLEQIKEILCNKRDRTLFLIDGYDELNVNEENRCVVKPILNEMLNCPNIIMTSRPYTVDKVIHQKFAISLENTGFNDKNIKQYIERYFSKAESQDVKDNLLKALKRNSSLQGICYVPINLYLICTIWEQVTANTSFNTINVTTIYNEIVTEIMKKYLLRNRKLKQSELSKEAIEEKCKLELELLEKLAYEGMEAGKVVIVWSIIKPTLHQTLENAKVTGLLKITNKLEEKVEAKKYYFAHLTFQEYFAAKYLYKQLCSKNKVEVEKVVKFIDDHKYEAKYERVIQFIAGIASTDKNQIQGLLQFWNIILNGKADLNMINQYSLIINCLEESNIDERIPELDKILAYIKAGLPDFTIEGAESSNTDDLIARCFNVAPKIIERIGLINLLISGLRLRNLATLSFANNSVITNNDSQKQVISEIILLFKDSNPNMRKFAVDALGWFKIENKELQKQVITEIISLVKDDDPDVRRFAIHTLGKLKIEDREVQKQVITEAMPLLKYGHSYVRSSAVILLNNIKVEDRKLQKQIITEIISSVKDDDPDVRSFAITHLKNIKIEDKKVQKQVVIGIIHLVKDGDPEVRSFAITHLKNIKIEDKKVQKQVITEIIPLLKNGNPDVRRFAAGVLGRLKVEDSELQKQIVSAFIPLLKNDDPYMRTHAADALCKVNTEDNELQKQVISALMLLLKNDDPYMRIEAANALCEVNTKDSELQKQVISALMLLLKNDDLYARICAADALCKVNTEDNELQKQVISAMILLLENDDPYVRIHAARALCKVNMEDNELQKQVISAMILLLENDDPYVRIHAARALCKVNTEDNELQKQVISAMILLLENDNSNVCIRAANILFEVNTKDSELQKQINSALVSLFENGSPIVCIHVAETLSEFKIDNNELQKQIISALVMLLDNDHPYVCMRAASALRRFKIENKELQEQAIIKLTPLIQNDNLHMRMCAADVLYKINTEDTELKKRIISALVYLLKEDNRSMRTRAVSALGRFRIENIELHKQLVVELITLFKYKNLKTRLTILKILGDFKISDALLNNQLIEGLVSIYDYCDISLKAEIKETFNIMIRVSAINNTKFFITENNFHLINPERFETITIDIDNLTIYKSHEKYILKFAQNDGILAYKIFKIFYQELIDQSLPTLMLDNMERYTKMVNIKLDIPVDHIILSTTVLNKCSIVNSAHLIDSDMWAISIILKDKAVTKYPKHCFLIFEGKNIFYNTVVHRLELTQPNPNSDRSFIEITSHLNVTHENLQRLFQKTLGNMRYIENDDNTKFESQVHYYGKTCSIPYYIAMEILADANEQKEHPPKYALRGEGASSVRKDSHNCYTWARKLLKSHLDQEVYEGLKLESWKDLLVADPTGYIKNNNSASYCSIL